jgi:acetyltransferase-like isoleucine patch superfamily enzyme
MEEGAQIGSFTVVKSLQKVQMGQGSSIGRGNWITGYPLNGKSFRHQPGRRCELILHAHAAITHRHIIDCTGGVSVGAFTTLAGYHSQILTHSIDLVMNRQNSGGVEIGRYCFIGTNCVILGGSRLPDFSVLGAKALLNHPLVETHSLYAGVPAVLIKSLPCDLAYFQRTTGFVD